MNGMSWSLYIINFVTLKNKNLKIKNYYFFYWQITFCVNEITFWVNKNKIEINNTYYDNH
jgi:hypothetical protein